MPVSRDNDDKATRGGAERPLRARKKAGTAVKSSQGSDVATQHRYEIEDWTHNPPEWTKDPYEPLAPIGVRSQALEEFDEAINIGPLKKIYLIWMVGASCDGCTVAVSGGTPSPRRAPPSGHHPWAAASRDHPHRLVGRVRPRVGA